MCFNLFNTIWFIPLIGVLVMVVTKIVPDKKQDKLPSEPVFLDYNVLDRPFAAIHLATQELIRLARMTFEMISLSEKSFVKNDAAAARKIGEEEENVNDLQENIVNYLAGMFTTDTITEEQAAKVSGLLHVAADIEHIGDHCKNISEFASEKIKNSYEFSEEAYEEVGRCFSLAKEMAEKSIEAMKNGDIKVANDIKNLENVMNEQEKNLRMQHMIRINQKKCSPEFTVIYTDVIHNIEKIGDYCNNIAEAVADNAVEKSENL